MAKDEEPTSAIARRVLDRYKAGIPLFTREVLEDLDRQLEEGKNRVTIKDYFGHECIYALDSSESVAVNIVYSSIEKLTQLRPGDPGTEFNERPVTISHTLHDKGEQATLEQTRSLFERGRAAWEQSKTCRDLTKQLKKFTPAQAAAITKIVGFGLGGVTFIDLTSVDGIMKTRREHTQHMALQTMAEVLKMQNGGREVKCYAQDPAYKGAGNEFLRNIGITPLDDPKGFLAVDDKTLVVSVHPNMPIRQVLADLQYPAAMLWNTIEEPVKREWGEIVEEDGEAVVVCPYTTDPVSSRVFQMAEGYDLLPFNDADWFFGRLTWYVRKNAKGT